MSNDERSQENGQEEFTIDPAVKEELENIPTEDPFLTEYATQGENGQEKTRFAEKWFPGEEEWQGKTNITYRQARALALARHLPKAFEEIEDLEPFLLNVIQDYEKYLTSVEGISREQQAGILRSMFGGASQETEEARSAVLTALAGKEGDSDD